METRKQKDFLIERLEDLVHALEGSTIGELELAEAGTEIIIRRSPGMLLMPQQAGAQAVSGAAVPNEDTSVAIVAPLTGVYYSAPSPTSPPFVNKGEVIQVGQVIALIESMKVFNEVQAEVSGRVSALVATSGNVVQKNDVLLRVVPI